MPPSDINHGQGPIIQILNCSKEDASVLDNPEAGNQAEHGETEKAFFEDIDKWGGAIPELGERKDQAKEAGAEIIADFDIQPSLFEDSGRSIVFAALADRYGQLQSGESRRSSKVAEKEVIADAVFLLAKDHFDGFDEIKAELQEEENPGQLSEQRRVEVYDKYTDRRMTTELTQSIENGLLVGVRERLGVTEDNEDPFNVRVLSILPGNEDIGLESNDLDWGEIQEWREGLKARQDAMHEELGMSTSAPAWVTELDGTTTLVVSMPLAEKLLYPEVTEGAQYYKEADARKDLATLEHEYTHTQGGLHVDRDLSFGIALEERRAEYFSGDEHGYRDVKDFFDDLSFASGFEVRTHLFDQQDLKGGNHEAVFVELANQFGVQGMLEILAALPSPYDVEQSNELRANLQHAWGGMEGASMRVLEAGLGAGKEDEIMARVEEFGDKVAGIYYKGHDNDILNYTMNRRGNPAITSLIKSAASRASYKRKLESIQF